MSAAERYKGHDALLDAWPAVRARVPDATLVLAGGGDDLERLEARARTLGHAGIQITGFLAPDALDALYHQAAVFALPSRGEGFGLVYLEAMARGVPCIGSIHDAAREIIEHERTGYLVDQGQPEELADRLATLLIDRRLRQAMGARGRDRFDREFTFERFRTRFTNAIAAHAPALRPARPARERQSA
jgi:phosphatidylinositol alpha-1,6-mannosyltransferase